jgi:phosphatidylserine/phosphatidylglycerophosphate/cardiolipin synthase-like enzyme
MKNHQPVTVEEFTGKNIKLPLPEEVPNVDIQVINYHRPTFGTFHSKFMVVDRKIAVICSNNIQVSRTSPCK